MGFAEVMLFMVKVLKKPPAVYKNWGGELGFGEVK
jgi:hypothetical protein